MGSTRQSVHGAIGADKQDGEVDEKGTESIGRNDHDQATACFSFLDVLRFVICRWGDERFFFQLLGQDGLLFDWPPNRRLLPRFRARSRREQMWPRPVRVETN